RAVLDRVIQEVGKDLRVPVGIASNAQWDRWTRQYDAWTLLVFMHADGYRSRDTKIERHNLEAERTGPDPSVIEQVVDETRHAARLLSEQLERLSRTHGIFCQESLGALGLTVDRGQRCT